LVAASALIESPNVTVIRLAFFATDGLRQAVCTHQYVSQLMESFLGSGLLAVARAVYLVPGEK
jgi:hypothetical protein